MCEKKETKKTIKYYRNKNKFKNYRKRLRVGWKFHKLFKILSWNATKWSLLFNIVPPPRIAVCRILPSVLQFLDPISKEAYILFVKSFHNSRYDLLYCDTDSQPNDFHFGEQMIVRWGQIKRIGRLINQFKSHCYTQQPLKFMTCAGALSCDGADPNTPVYINVQTPKHKCEISDTPEYINVQTPTHLQIYMCRPKH